jgi:hypothetical protein
MIHFLISFLIFVIVVVILFKIAKWGLRATGVAIDPELMNIIYLILFLLLVVVFLNYVGAIDIGSWGSSLRK